MKRYQDVAIVEDKYLVLDIDEAIRTQRRTIKPPWVLKKTTLRIFENVLIYPVPDDHDYLAYLDNQLIQQASPTSTARRNAFFVYTSLEQFYENETARNRLVDIWDQGTRYLGIKYNPINAASALVSSVDLADYTASGDANNLFLETVITVDNTDSVGFHVTNTSNPALIEETMPNPISDNEYKKKYYFRWAYFYDDVPTGIQLRWGNDSSNYLYANITAQFSGQTFQPNSWNLVAIDLNTASTAGTIDDQNFRYEAIQFTGLATGVYYINNAYLRTWHLFDYWYYSKFNVKSPDSLVADQQFFFDDTIDDYELDAALVGDSEWIDVITFDAIMTALADNKNKDVIQSIIAKRTEAWNQLSMKYPDMAPVIITSSYNFSGDPNITGWAGGVGGDLNGWWNN